jgi:hypothetical protein
MVYGLFIMDLASLVVGDMEHYTHTQQKGQ